VTTIYVTQHRMSNDRVIRNELGNMYKKVFDSLKEFSLCVPLPGIEFGSPRWEDSIWLNYGTIPLQNNKQNFCLVLFQSFCFRIGHGKIESSCNECVVWIVGWYPAASRATGSCEDRKRNSR